MLFLCKITRTICAEYQSAGLFWKRTQRSRRCHAIVCMVYHQHTALKSPVSFEVVELPNIKLHAIFLTQIYHFSAISQCLCLSFAPFFLLFPPIVHAVCIHPIHSRIVCHPPTHRIICKRTDSNHSHEFAMFAWHVRQRGFERFSIRCLLLWAAAVAFYNRASHSACCCPSCTVASARWRF